MRQGLGRGRKDEEGGTGADGDGPSGEVLHGDSLVRGGRRRDTQFRRVAVIPVVPPTWLRTPDGISSLRPPHTTRLAHSSFIYGLAPTKEES
ncbi:hypothetical protein GCM10009738_11200 [Kitasatospora viridis]